MLTPQPPHRETSINRLQIGVSPPTAGPPISPLAPPLAHRRPTMAPPNRTHLDRLQIGVSSPTDQLAVDQPHLDRLQIGVSPPTDQLAVDQPPGALAFPFPADLE